MIDYNSFFIQIPLSFFHKFGELTNNKFLCDMFPFPLPSEHPWQDFERLSVAAFIVFRINTFLLEKRCTLKDIFPGDGKKFLLESQVNLKEIGLGKQIGSGMWIRNSVLQKDDETTIKSRNKKKQKDPLIVIVPKLSHQQNQKRPLEEKIQPPLKRSKRIKSKTAHGDINKDKELQKKGDDKGKTSNEGNLH